MINCTPTDVLHLALENLAAATRLPIGAYGNVGHTDSEQGWTPSDGMDAAEYGMYARRWLEIGARLVGCCCGTTSEHLRAVAAMLR